jgi:hypothetical protein
MVETASFNPLRTDLEDLLKWSHRASLQLPDFQRSWIWDDGRIISLIESVARGFPIGAILTLKSDGGRFLCRPIEGVKLADKSKPEKLLLDGQQRLTSLYRSLRSPDPVETRDQKGKKIYRYYYANLNKIAERADSGNFEDCFFSVNQDRKITRLRDTLLDLSTREREWQEAMLPLNVIFDFMAFEDWADGFRGINPLGKELLQKARMTAIKNIMKYSIPVIELDSNTTTEAVCTIFEKVNTGGVPLTVFELLVATYAAAGFKLVEDWEAQRKRMVDSTQGLLKNVDNVSYLTAVLVASQIRGGSRITCKRGDLLSMSEDTYVDNRESVTSGFIRAARLLHSEGIIVPQDIPYQTQLAPLAAVYAIITEGKASLDPIRTKLSRWFWCGVFGEQWASGVDSRIARDVPQIIMWLHGGPDEPESIKESLLTEDRLLSLNSRISAAYKGVSALMYRAGAKDFRSGEPITTPMVFDNNIDIHHIFPRAACDKLKVDRSRRECIVNKTPIDAVTNRSIGGYLPSQYLTNLETNPKYLIPKERLDRALESHLVDVPAIRSNDFEEFFRKRKESIIGLIEGVMGKKIIRGVPEEGEEVTEKEDGAS